MRYMLAAISTIALVAASLAQAPAAPAVIVIRAGMLIDGKSGEPRHDQVIIIRGDRIESVSDASSTKPPAGATVIDLSKATVLPGLIDSHTHIFLQGEEPSQGGYDDNILRQGIALRAARATVSVRRALEQGFTTLRDLETEGAGYGDVEIKQALRRATFLVRGCSSRRARFQPPVVTRWKATLPSLRCRRGRRSWM